MLRSLRFCEFGQKRQWMESGQEEDLSQLAAPHFLLLRGREQGLAKLHHPLFRIGPQCAWRSIMKVAKACRQCRESKRKCTRQDYMQRCTPCMHKQLSCSLATTLACRPHAPILPQPQRTAAITTGSFPPQSLIQELVDLYITLIHDKPHSLFHEPSIRQAAAQETISKQVLYGILGLSARHAPRPFLAIFQPLIGKDSTTMLPCVRAGRLMHWRPSAC